MKMRTIVVVGFLNFYFVHTQAMWGRFSEWFEDPTPHIAITKCIIPEDEIIYNALISASRKSFAELNIPDGMPIAQVIIFTAADKRKVQEYHVWDKIDKLKKICHLGVITFYPLMILKDCKEGDKVWLDNQMVLCDQNAIDPITFQKKVASVYKLPLKGIE